MTVSYPTISALKEAKNSVIGNPTAKRALAKDEGFIGMLVDCIQNPETHAKGSRGPDEDVRIEAAHILASLSYGPSDALRTLLKYQAHRAFLIALSTMQPSDPPALKPALARGLRVLTVALADSVGPSEWGLQSQMPDTSSDAKDTLDTLFQIDSLDIYLPLLCDPSTPTCISIAQLLANSLRLQYYRLAISDWLPPSERHKEVKGKRGWEKTEPINTGSTGGGWVARQLSALLGKKDVKLQEAALSALSSLARDNPHVALKLARPSPSEQQTVLQSVLALCKSRSTDLQVAACLCATSIVRAGLSPQFLHIDHVPATTVVYVVNSLIASDTEKSQTRLKACYILYQLVCDDKDICQLAFERGSLTKLANLLKSITPSEASPGWDEDEPESVSRLREAALTAIAAIALFDNDIRNEMTDTLKLIPYIQNSLAHHHPGVRYAACQCVRALSRAVSVLRTNIVDSGLGLAVYQVFCKTDEDPRVRHAASSVICNLVNDFSPLKSTLLEQGVIRQCVQLLDYSEQALALNALWTIKNVLYKSSTELKREVMRELGWGRLQNFLNHDNLEFQEQAFHVIRNIADTEAGIDMVFDGLGADVLLSHLSRGLESSSDEVLRQAAYVLGNLVNSTAHQHQILAHRRILISLRQCLVDAKVDVRRPAISCVRELIRVNPHSYAELHEAGIDTTLRHMCDYGGGLMASSPTVSTLSMGVEEDSEVREKAREALRWLERSGEMGI